MLSKIKNIKYSQWRLLILSIALALFVINIIRLDFTMPFTSDGVYTQNLLNVFKDHIHQESIFSEDTYLAKAPFYWLIMHLGLSIHSQLVTSLTVFTFFCFALFYISITLLNRDGKWFKPIYFDLGFLYLVSLSRIYEYMMIPSSRNIEFGVSFLLLVPLYLSVKRKRPYWLYAVTVLAIGILMFDDPYFVYTIFAPLFLILFISLALSKKIKSRRAVPLVLIALSYILFRVFSLIASKLGLFIGLLAIKLVSVGKLLANFKATLAGLLLLGGGVYYKGGFHNVPTSFAYNGVVIASLMIFSLIYILFNVKHFKDDPWRIYLIGISLIISVIFLVQPTSITTDYRYVMLAAFGFPIIMAFALQSLRKSNFVYGAMLFILIAIFFNMQYSSRALAVNKNPNQINVTVSQYIEKLGLKKGYADYWDGNINTFYASSKAYFLPVTCVKGELQPMFWLVDSGEFTKVHVKQSFYLYDTLGYYIQGCTLSEVSKYYGSPEYVKKINSEYSVAVYNYDLSSKMLLNYPTH